MRTPHRTFRVQLSLIVLTLAASVLVPTATASATGATDDPATGASSLPLPSDALVLHVESSDGLHYWPYTALWPDGSSDLPFPSISWAVGWAQVLRREGNAVRIVVGPGTYRETIAVGNASGSAQPLVIEAAQPGSVVVSGADVEHRLSPIEGTRLVSLPWDQAWGLMPIPSGWSGVAVPDLIRRREAVLVDGTALTQVATEGALVPGSFLVDEAGGRILVDPPSGVVDLADHVVEVGRRDRVLRIHGLARSVAVKGLVFEAAVPGLERHMAYVSDSTDVLLEGNTFRHSGWGGLGTYNVTGITVRGNRAIDNGGNGIDTNRTRNALIEGNHLERNNVLGARHGFTGWSTAGSKNLRLHGAVFRGNTYESNLARGLWFDTDVQDVLVDGDRACGNLRAGMFIEVVQGPITIRDSVVCDNLGAGIAIANSRSGRVQGSTIRDNTWGQLVFSTSHRLRYGTDHLTGEVYEIGRFEDWAFADNEVTTGGSAPLIHAPATPLHEWRELLGRGEITASGNAWSRPSMDDAIWIQLVTYPWDEWRAATGDELVSVEPAEPGAPEVPVPGHPAEPDGPEPDDATTPEGPVGDDDSAEPGPGPEPATPTKGNKGGGGGGGKAGANGAEDADGSEVAGAPRSSAGPGKASKTK